MKTVAKLADAYYRLSNDDAITGDSGSIINQRNIVRKYCIENNIIIVKEFVDDGFSGGNFDRPAFREMLKHISTGEVNMVITKDLSRLGRDMSESSRYAEQYFPEHGIQYLAISDNFDSEETNIMAPFQFAMNDVYLRETSKKIKLVLQNKRANGEYCACPPFGYMRNPNDKTRIVPDPNTAPIVQKIFYLANEGDSCHSIATKLTQDGDITPLKYRVLYRDNFSNKGAARSTDSWSHVTVKRILKNPVYLGHTVLGKTKKASVKSHKKIKIPETSWSITENTHPPLITETQFNQAKAYMNMHTKEWAKNERHRVSIFQGVAFCANCGAAMCSGGTVYKGERDKYWYLSCNNISRKDNKKCNHGARIKYADLIDIVKKDLNKMIQLSEDDIKKIISAASKPESNIYKDQENQLVFIKKRLSEIDRIITKLYQDNISGIINDERLSSIVSELSNESNILIARQNELQSSNKEKNDIEKAYNSFYNLIKDYTDFDDLTPKIIRTFIERIEVGEKILPDGYQIASHTNIPYKQNIKIIYRFIGEPSQETVNY